MDRVGAPGSPRGTLPVKGWLTEKLGKPKLDKLDLNRVHGSPSEIQAFNLQGLLLWTAPALRFGKAAADRSGALLQSRAIGNVFGEGRNHRLAFLAN